MDKQLKSLIKKCSSALRQFDTKIAVELELCETWDITHIHFLEQLLKSALTIIENNEYWRKENHTQKKEIAKLRDKLLKI